MLGAERPPTSGEKVRGGCAPVSNHMGGGGEACTLLGGAIAAGTGSAGLLRDLELERGLRLFQVPLPLRRLRQELVGGR